MDDASNCCKDESHVCSKNELFQGGYRIAKMMGWIKFNDYSSVWTYEEYEANSGDIEPLSNTSKTTNLDDTQYDNLKKVVVCCLNNNRE